MLRVLVLALVAAMSGVGTGVPAASAQVAADEGGVGEVALARVAEIYMWTAEFEATVDGLIEATRSFPSFWSGSQNRDSEDERIARAREIVLAEREEVLSDAAQRLQPALEADELAAHLSRIEAGDFGTADVPYRDAVHEAYRDAIFDALSRAGRRANEEIEGF